VTLPHMTLYGDQAKLQMAASTPRLHRRPGRFSRYAQPDSAWHITFPGQFLMADSGT
jgi:hypothetical protein